MAPGGAAAGGGGAAPALGEAGPLSPAEVASWRERFPILGRCTYLISNSLGAMPASVPASLARFTDAWAERGVEAWPEWLAEARRIADVLAALVGAPPGSVVVHQNVASLAAMVLSALEPTAARRRVVVSDLEWPGHRYLLERYERRGLLDVRVVPTDGVHVDAAALLAEIDERTLLVPVSHVTFRSACVVDVEAVCTRAREVGAVTLVDGYHAAGHLPVDVGRIGCDLYVGGSVKWLCGGPGVGYLYVRPGSGLEPDDVGWLGHARPLDFDDAWEPSAGAWGWLGGTPSIPALFAAREGYRVVTEVGPERIRATSLALTARLVEGALARGLTVRTPLDAARRGGAVTIDLGPGTGEAARRLVEGGIVVDHRPGAGIRAGPHFYNTVEECDALLDALPV